MKAARDHDQWMTRSEAAAYLHVSVRQLTRLRLPRTLVGRRARYSRDEIDGYLAAHTYTPGPDKVRAARKAAPRLDTAPTDMVAWLAQLKRDLGRR